MVKLTRLKQASVLIALLILAGCGGSPQAKTLLVTGQGYHFTAPAGWSIKRSHLGVTATGGSDLAQVFRFPLVKAYRPALFVAVARELQMRMQQLAGQTGGKVEAAGEATVGGVRSHVYRLEVGGHVDEYTFVLVGRREYQLLCRAKTAGDEVCRQLQSSFRLD